MRTIPLPFVNEDNFSGGSDYYLSAQWKDTSNQEAEEPGCGQAKHYKYEDQSGVSNFFYPAEDRAL